MFLRTNELQKVKILEATDNYIQTNNLCQKCYTYTRYKNVFLVQDLCLYYY